VDGVPTAAIVLYPKTIAEMISPSLLLGPGVHERSPFDYDRVLGRVMGRALAHEIGHYLLRSRGHSASGVIRPSPQINELSEQNRRGFGLGAGDRTRLMALMPDYSRRRESVAPAPEETAFGGVLAPCDRGVEGGERLAPAAEALQEIGADGVE